MDSTAKSPLQWNNRVIHFIIGVIMGVGSEGQGGGGLWPPPLDIHTWDKYSR